MIFDGKRGRESENSLSLFAIFPNFWNFQIHEYSTIVSKKKNDIFRYEAKKSEISFGPVYFRIFGIFRRLEQRANRIEIKTTRSIVERAKFPLLDIFGPLRSNTRMPLDTKSEISSFWNIEIRRICFRTNQHQRLNKFVSLNFY